MDKRWIDYLKEPKQKMPEYVFLFADGSFRWKELVRCKDCKHFIPDPHFEDEFICLAWADKHWHYEEIESTDPNGYCHMGERRDDE